MKYLESSNMNAIKSYRFINDSKSVEWRVLSAICQQAAALGESHRINDTILSHAGVLAWLQATSWTSTDWNDWVLHVSSASIALFSHRFHLIEANLPMYTWNFDDYDDYDLCPAWLWNLISNPCMLSNCYHLQLLIWVTWPNNGTCGSWGVTDFTRL